MKDTIKSTIKKNNNGNPRLSRDATYQGILCYTINIENEFKYKLVRESDNLKKESKDVKWLEFDNQREFSGEFTEPAIGRVLLMSPFNPYFTWQTTEITEILEERDGYINFKTKNSKYELFTL